MGKIPRHIAIIMDGNGRWARKRALPSIMGHHKGVETVDRIVEAAARMEIEYLTLYTFSTENWKRSEQEVNALMGLLSNTMEKEASKLFENNVKFNTIGQIERLPGELAEAIKKLIKGTEQNTGMFLSLALSYGGRQEIIDAAKKLCNENMSKGKDCKEISEEDFEKCLYTAGMPDPDLVIRTSGEMRTSNFLLWQTAYSEFYVTDTLWPDFSVDEFKKAIDAFGNRKRRFGE